MSIKTKKSFHINDNIIGSCNLHESNGIIFGTADYGIITSGYSGENRGTFAGGFATGSVGNYGSIIASENGSFATGKVISGLIEASKGGFAQGYANNGKIYSKNSTGVFTQGYVKDSSKIFSYDSLNISKGCFAQGYAKAGKYIKSTHLGSSAQGYAYKGNISSINHGSFAQGCASQYWSSYIYDASITASGKGSFAQGYSEKTITASGDGSFAQGRTSVGYITAAGLGCFVQGRADGGNLVSSSSSIGSFMQGSTKTGGDLYNKSKGSFIQGEAIQNGYIGHKGVNSNGVFIQGYSNNLNLYTTENSFGVFIQGTSSQCSGKGLFSQGSSICSGNGLFGQGGSNTGNGNFTQGIAPINDVGSKGCFAQGRKSQAAGLLKNYINTEGCFAQGEAYSAKIYNKGKGNFSQGCTVFLSRNIHCNSYGSFAQGYNVGGYIQAVNKGSFAQGYTNSDRSAYGGIIASGLGSFSQGCTREEGSVNNFITSKIRASSKGSFAQGYLTAGDILSSSYGTFSQGNAGHGKIFASAKGSFAQGFTDAEVLPGGLGPDYLSDGKVYASGKGSFTQGYSKVRFNIENKLDGSFVQGYNGGGNFYSEYKGSFVQGCVITGSFQCSSSGSFIQGYSYSGVFNITNLGSFIHACATGTGYVSCTGKGSFVNGYVTTGQSLKSLADGAVVFCSNASASNSETNSLQVGPDTTQVRVLGSGVPTTPRNGDIWLNNTNVYIYSNGAIKNLSLI